MTQQVGDIIRIPAGDTVSGSRPAIVLDIDDAGALTVRVLYPLGDDVTLYSVDELGEPFDYEAAAAATVTPAPSPPTASDPNATQPIAVQPGQEPQQS